MQRPGVFIRCVLFAGCALVASQRSADARPDTLAASSARAVAALRATIRADERLYASAIRTVLADVRAARTTPGAGFVTHATALAFLLQKLDAATDAAAEAFLDDAQSAMAAGGDAALRGAVPGDGGSFDRFEAAVRRELERARSRTGSRARTFARSLATAAGGNSVVRVSLPPWEFGVRSVPTPEGLVGGAEEPLRLRAISGARFFDGRVFVALAGTADPASSGEFDVRLRGATNDRVGPGLDAGGVPVADGGTWSFGGEVGDPFAGEVPLAGNRVVQFGVEPFDAGVGGRQPGRIEHGGVFGLP